MIVTVVSTGTATMLTEPVIVTVVSMDTAAIDEIYDCYSCVNGYCNNVDGTAIAHLGSQDKTVTSRFVLN